MKERKLRSDRYSENGELKKCSGFLHRENPVMLPLSHFHMLKSGHMAGKPMAECIECWRSRRGLDPAQRRVDRAEWVPVMTRLIEIVGSQAEVARKIGRFPSTLSRAKTNNQMGADLFRDMQNLLRDVEVEQKGNHVNWKRGEAEVVDAHEFSVILKKFAEDWLRERPKNSWSGTETLEEDEKEGFYGPVDWLAEKAELNVRRVQAFLNEEIENVPLSQADALMQAMNLTHLWGITIHVKPNPQWSMESYMAYMKERGCI